MIWSSKTEIWVILGQNWYFDFHCETVKAISFKLGTSTTISDLHVYITLLFDLIQYDWNVGHFGSKLIFWLPLWKSDSYFSQTWHTDKTCWHTCSHHIIFVILFNMTEFLGHFWSKLVFWLLQWNGDSYFIQTWHKDNTYWRTCAHHFVLWFDPIWLKIWSLLVKIVILTSTVKKWQLSHSNLAQTEYLVT